MAEGRHLPVNPPKALVVEDDLAQVEILRYNLVAEGFDVSAVGSGDQAMQMVETEEPDIILLDWVLPGLSGIEICRRVKIQPRTMHIPIIMLSARAEEMDRVRSLETGADDYMVKPYSVMELMARVRALMRRVRPSGAAMVTEHGAISVDSEALRVYVDGRPVHLGPTEFRILCVLIERPGRVLTREQLRDRVWGAGVHIETRTIDVHIGRLRKALGQEGRRDYPLRTVRGAGYALG